MDKVIYVDFLGFITLFQ